MAHDRDVDSEGLDSWEEQEGVEVSRSRFLVDCRDGEGDGEAGYKALVLMLSFGLAVAVVGM